MVGLGDADAQVAELVPVDERHGLQDAGLESPAALERLAPVAHVALLHDVFYPSISSGSSAPPHQGRPSYSRWSAFNAAITSQPKGSAEKFKRWTQRCAGLAPVALSHMASNAVGCDWYSLTILNSLFMG